DPDDLRKWVFPSVNLPAGGYMVGFASDSDLTDPAGELHTNFKLKGEGEYLGLVRPDLGVEHEYAPQFPPQITDVSYGLEQGTGGDPIVGFFATPTPGGPNGAAADSGPTVAQVTDNPPRPADDENLVITAEVTQRFAPVDVVALHYIVMFGSESVVPMLDDGAGEDAAAGDGVYTAVIPSMSYGPGQMVRWYVSAADSDGRGSRMPMHLNLSKAPDYFGTVVFDPAADPAQIDMPVLEWFVEDMSWRTFMLTEANYYTWKQDPANWGDAFLYHDGRFYSGVRVRVRGSYTLYAGGNYHLRKLKFEMTDGQWFQYSPDEDPVEEFNIQMFYTDQADLMREPLAVETFQLAGVPTFQCFHIHLRNNGAFYGPAAFVEQMDERFLERVGLDPVGALYKPTGPQMTAPVSQSDLRPDWMNPYGVYRKYTRQEEDWSDFDELREGLVLAPGSDELKRFMFDNLDLAEVTNYMAASALIMHCDRCEKNYYMYRDSEGDREWSILPWDMELSLERWKTDNPKYYSLDYGDYNDHSWLDWDYGPGNPHTGLYIDSYNRLYDAILRMPETREMYLRRLRTLMDTILEPAPGYMEGRVDYFSNLAGGSGASVRYGLSRRRSQLFGHPEIPAPQVGSPPILFGAVEYTPASGLPDEQYVELQNPNPFAVDVSGWTLAGSVDFTFAPGTVIGAGASLYVSPNLVSFRDRPTGPAGDQGLFVVGGYDGRLRRDGQWLWLLDAEGGQVDSVFVGDEAVVINEVLANSDGGAGDWVELHNLTDQPVDVGGWWLSDLPYIPARWRIPDGTEIGAGGYVVFNERDHFGGTFGLDAGGEWIVLSDAGGGSVDMQAFGNAEAGVTFGRHLSDDGVDFTALSAATMDAANADPLVGPVVINEVMYHPVDGEDEFIELHNVTGAA
ncbi:MAG: lamin tail domain-containing protein, partial [Planctomycetota bacterium]